MPKPGRSRSELSSVRIVFPSTTTATNVHHSTEASAPVTCSPSPPLSAACGPPAHQLPPPRPRPWQRAACVAFFRNLGVVHVPCVVKLSPLQFTLTWWLFAVVHALSSGYFFSVTYVHYYILHVQLDATMAALGSDVMGYFPAVMAINGALCVLHALCVVAPILGSLQRKELGFQWPRRCQSNKSHQVQATTCQSNDRHQQHQHQDHHENDAMPIMDKFFSSAGLFGIESVHFDVVFRLMELVEGASQVYQAWKLSHLVPTVWVNRMFAVILVLSFWSTPLLHRLCGHRAALHRVLCLAMDTLFDFVSLTVFPLTVFWPYAKAFDPSYGDFPTFFYYEDTSFINAVAENQHLFAMGAFDLLTKTIPALSVLLSLVSLRSCIVKKTTMATEQLLLSAAPAAATDSLLSLVETRPTSPIATTTTTTPSSSFATPMTYRKHRTSLLDRGHLKPFWETRFHRILNLIFVVAGALIALVHLSATAVANLNRNDGCYLNLRPWFSTTYDCAVLEVNCETLGHVGHEQDMTQALQGFNDAMLRALILTGCPELEMPPRIQDFPSLQMLKIYNSSIQKWTSDAALTGTHHPTITLLYIVHTNFSDPSTLPPGLLSDDFPESLQDIEFCGTNLVSLPRVLKAKWQFVQYFVLENSPGITEFPMALVELRVPQLSLCGYQITSIPDELLVNQSFWSLSLTGNPITNLPASIGALDKLYRLRLGFTGLATVPHWMQDGEVSAAVGTFEQTVDVKAGGSPVCGGVSLRNASPPPTSKYFAIDCSTDPEENWPLVYPLERKKNCAPRGSRAYENNQVGPEGEPTSPVGWRCRCLEFLTRSRLCFPFQYN